MLKFSTKKLLATSSVIILFMLQGCATQNIKLSDKDRTEIKKLKKVTAFHMPSGWPSLKTPLGVLASELTLGLSEDWSEGQKLVHKFKIGDPSKTLKYKFIKQLNHKKKSANFTVNNTPLVQDDLEIENFKKKHKSGVVLQILPGTWQIWYYPFNWARYQMWYRASAKLIRLDDSKVLWTAACKANQDNSETAPTLDEITADNSNVLKGWVDKSTSQCAKQLVNDYLGISVQE